MDPHPTNPPLPAVRVAVERTPAVVAPPDLASAWLAGRSESTLRAYARDLADFLAFLRDRHGRPDLAHPDVFFSPAIPAGEAHGIALAYRAELTGRKLAPATIARRLAALRSLAKLARQLGRIAWSLEVEGPSAEAYRDVRGPGSDGWGRMLDHATREARSGRPAKVRDLAILRLLHDSALRRGEAAGLDLDQVELDEEPPGVWILGKGRTQRERVTIGDEASDSLRAWIEARGPWPGPLFVRCDRPPIGPHLGPIDGETINRMVRALGLVVGVKRRVRAHGLRHEAITEALDAGFDVRDVRQFSRHRKLETLILYDDRRKDVAGDIARRIGKGRGGRAG